MARIIVFLLAFSPVTSAWGSTCPKGKVFNRKQLRCVRISRPTGGHLPLCPSRKIRVKGRCVVFPYKTLTYKVPFVKKLKGLTIPQAARAQLKTGLPLYEKRRFGLAKPYIQRAYRLFPHEVLGHMLGECYRRTGEYYYGSFHYAGLAFGGKDPELKKLAQRLSVRFKDLRSGLSKCQRDKTTCSTVFALLRQEEGEGYSFAGMARVFYAEINGLSTGGGDVLKKMCHDGEMMACVAYSALLMKSRKRESLQMQYLKIACDGGELEGCEGLAGVLEKKKRYGEALRYLTQGCRMGYESSCFAVGRHIARKLPTAQKARAVLTRECEVGPRRGGPLGRPKWVNPEACLALGHVENYYLKRPKKAALWLKKACNMGHSGSCMDLGGQLKDSNRYAAVAAYNKACSAGVAEACKRSGQIYAKDQNFSEALIWYDKYASHFSVPCRAGDRQSCATLVRFFGETVKSVVRQRPWALALAKLQEKDCGPSDLSSCQGAMETYETILKDAKKVCSIARVLCTAKVARGCRKAANCGIALGTIKPGSTSDPYYTLLKAQCDAGNFRSCNDCGIWMQNHKNTAAALQFFKTACTGGFTYGCVDAGKIYETKLKKGREAGTWYMKGCRLKHWTSCNYAEYYYLRVKDTWSLKQVWRVQADAAQERCNRKEYHGCLRAAELYLKANEAAQARLLLDKGLRHYSPRCLKGDTESCNTLGFYLVRSKATFKQALVYFKKSCGLKNLQGCYRYGMYLGHSGNAKESRRVLKRACAQKHVPSCHLLNGR